MLSRSLEVFLYFAVLLGYVLIISSTASRIQHHVYRFAFLFVALVPVNFVVNYVTVWAFGTARYSVWTGALIIALLLATPYFFPAANRTTQTHALTGDFNNYSENGCAAKVVGEIAIFHQLVCGLSHPRSSRPQVCLYIRRLG